VEKDDRFHISFNAMGMAELFYRADAAFISGGTLLYEACASGVPAIVISQNRAQAVEAAICHRAGAVVDLGVHDGITDDMIAASFARFLADADLRTRMSQLATKTVALDGAGRIASKLLSLVVREAKR
jgi:spore coat polysaccharide biosynthesis predicted glycosyltransferase SpsG